MFLIDEKPLYRLRTTVGQKITLGGAYDDGNELAAEIGDSMMLMEGD